VIVPAPIPLDTLPHTIEDPVKSEEQRKTDLERLQEGLENVRVLQQLANEYDITDIFQDNGGKVLQLLILLGLKQSKGREGNDAVDEEGNEYELKTINRSLNRNKKFRQLQRKASWVCFNFHILTKAKILRRTISVRNL